MNTHEQQITRFESLCLIETEWYWSQAVSEAGAVDDTDGLDARAQEISGIIFS